MTNATPSLADRCTIALDGMREEMAAQGARKGPAGALAKAILRLLEAFVALLADFKAGTLTDPSRSCVSTPPPELARSSRPGPTAEAGEGRESPVDPCPAAVAATGARAAVRQSHPSPSRFAGPSVSLKGRGNGTHATPVPPSPQIGARARRGHGLRRGPRSRLAADCAPTPIVRLAPQFASWGDLPLRRARRSCQIQKNGLRMRGPRAITLFRYRNSAILSAG
jgi:hypothetical protein